MPMAMIYSNPVHLRWLRVAAIALLVALVAGLFVGGAQPVAVGLIPAPWDKLVHATLFLVFALLIGVAGGQMALRGAGLLVLAVAGATLIGAADEWHQLYLPGRSAGLDDLAADFTGALVGAWLLHRLGLARRLVE
jgi:VanZ family protein